MPNVSPRVKTVQHYLQSTGFNKGTSGVSMSLQKLLDIRPAPGQTVIPLPKYFPHHLNINFNVERIFK